MPFPRPLCSAFQMFIFYVYMLLFMFFIYVIYVFIILSFRCNLSVAKSHWHGALCSTHKSCREAYLPMLLTHLIPHTRAVERHICQCCSLKYFLKKKIPKYHFVGICDETYQKVHGHYNLNGESGVYFKIMRKMLFS